MVYKSECTYLAASRKKKKKIVAPREAADTQSDSSSSSRVEALEALEARLRAALEENNVLKQHQKHDTRIVHNSEAFVEKETEVFSSRGQLDLPPEDIVLPLIQIYLSTFNCFFPLFDTPNLVKTVHNWYHSPSQRTSTTWASIYIAMALAQYQASQPPHAEVSVVDCLRKAQSVLSEIIISDAELTNVQVVLGLVLLFIGSPDPRPSTVLLATAMKLVHTMRLHRRDGYHGLPDSELLQRRRVFWIAYILDREISLRMRQPPIQHDSEIDVDLPSETADADGAGFITAMWSQETFNFFRARVKLAEIQGQVYDCVYSVAAQHMSPEMQAIKALEVRQAMRDWQGMIPLDFSAEVLSHDSTTILPQYFCQLYSSYVACLGQLCQATSMDPPWVEALLSYARTAAAGTPCEPPKVPEGWDTLVDASRSMMNLFMSVQHKEPAFIW